MAHPREFRVGVQIASAASAQEWADLARRGRWEVSYLVVQADAMDAAAPIVARLAGT